MTRKSAFFLAAVAVPTCYSVFVAMRSGLDPNDYYQQCAVLGCEFVPHYFRLAVTALFMAAEGFLVYYALAGSQYWPIWARAGAGVIPMAVVGSFLFVSAMHATHYHVIHLQWAIAVVLVLLTIMSGGLIVGLVRTLWEW